MARRRNMYGKRRKIRYGRIAFLAALLVLAALGAFSILRSTVYQDAIDDAMNSQIMKVSGTVSSVSKVDPKVYTNEGIRYTNQHEGIKRLASFDTAIAEDSDRNKQVKSLLENLSVSDETELVTELPQKEGGYYWMDVSVVVEDKFLVFEGEEQYNFDLYYDIENSKVYVREKYHDEFSTRNNKQKLQGYEADAEFKSLMEKLVQAE
ncbi:MAG: hypothetical protein AAGU76_04930 [Sedimentibacter sp.]|uniref:hypothetical protein n=1 Tax=Sedimentibacter sp. TaxID=1960295 RepID=UPI003158BCAE